MEAADQSCDVIIFAARRTTSTSLLDIIRDLSALGLLRRIHVVDVDSIREGDLRVPCWIVENGTAWVEILQDNLASSRGVERVRICAVTEAAETVQSVTADEAHSLQGVVRASLSHVSVTPVHAVGVTLQGAPVTEELAWLGWHNVVVAPENSAAPAAGISPIVATDTTLRKSHLVASLCSLMGVWLDEGGCAFDNRELLPGRMLVASRSYTRHLSATDVEDELLRRLVSMDEGLPVPNSDGSSAWVIEDEVTAVTDMADHLLDKYRHVMPRTREAPRATPPKSIGALTAIKMLFSFLWHALKNAPRAFLDAAVNQISQRAASLVGSTVFGTGDSEYIVVVKGVRSDGRPASWAEVDDAVANAASRLGVPRMTEGSNADLSNLWKDFVHAGLTLMDAGNRSSDLPPMTKGGRSAVLGTADRVAPNPADVFEPTASVGGYVKGWRLSSIDVVQSRLLDDELGALAVNQPHLRSIVEKDRARLREWFQPRVQSFTGRVGSTLGRAVRDTRKEIADLVDGLGRAVQAAAVPDAIADEQDRLAKKLRLLILVAVVVVVGIIALVVLGPLSLVIGAIVCVLVVGSWLVSSLLTFMKGQRNLFAMLHRREELNTQIELLRKHLAEAIEDLRRLSRAYRQYLDWSRALGTFVQAPLGSAPPEGGRHLVVGTGLPRNCRIGLARPEQPVIEEVAMLLKQDLFTVGWASGFWDSFVSDVPDELGKDAYRVRADPEVLWSDPGIARHSVLTAWSQAVADRGIRAGTSPELRERVSELLSSADSDMTSRLLAQVETRSFGAGDIEPLDYASFIGGLDSVQRVGGSHQAFDRQMFAAAPHTSEPWQVTETWTGEPSHQLSRTVVVIQLSSGFPGYDLELGSQPGGDSPDMVPVSPGSARRPVM
ncbi:MAG: hypothetical protein ABI903_10155 [Actinomycetota bacterium]